MARPPSPSRSPWLPADAPLTPCAVAAHGDAAVRLLDRVLTRASLEPLTGVIAGQWVVLLGPADALPWAEGVVYLGRHPDAPAVLFPTAIRPSLPIDLVARAIRLRAPGCDWPAAFLPGDVHGRFTAGADRSGVAPSPPDAVISLGDARPLGRAELTAARARLRAPG